MRELEEGAPAATDGIADGDLIVTAVGRQISSADDLFDALGTDGDLEIGLVRGAEELSVTVSG